MEPDLKTEISVGTWLAVIAEIARDRALNPTIMSIQQPDTMHALHYLDLAVRSRRSGMDHADAKEIRRNMLRIAAVAMRIADECFPGDGLFDTV